MHERRTVAIESDGIIEIHAAPVRGSYATLCGLDGDDAGVGQRPVSSSQRRIDCGDCTAIIRAAWRYTERDLVVTRRLVDVEQ